MDVAEFFSEFRRMCKSSSDCTKCEYHGDRCDNAIELLEKTVAVVEQWSLEHPRKTRQDAFLSLFPTGRLDKSGVLTICPAGVDVKLRDPDGTGCGINCDTCRRKFWMQEVE